jgi:hypothetical protein
VKSCRKTIFINKSTPIRRKRSKKCSHLNLTRGKGFNIFLFHSIRCYPLTKGNHGAQKKPIGQRILIPKTGKQSNQFPTIKISKRERF